MIHCVSNDCLFRVFVAQSKMMTNHHLISQRNGISHFFVPLFLVWFKTRIMKWNMLFNNFLLCRPPLVLSPIPTATTTKRPPPGVLLPVQTISRPPNPSNPLTISSIGQLNEISGNFVDEKQCGQQEVSTGNYYLKLFRFIYEYRKIF